MKVLRLLFATVVAIVGVALVWGGGVLASLHGSWFYLVAGMAYLAMAYCYAARRGTGVWLSAAIMAVTIVWALWETGLGYWGLVPRLVVPAILFGISILLAPLLPIRRTGGRRIAAYASVAVTAILLIATTVMAFFPQGALFAEEPQTAIRGIDADPATQNWAAFGRDNDGTRFAPFSQITPDNVRNLEVAWTYRTGRRITGKGVGVDENTPLQIGDTLYSCTPLNVISAIDADTGRERWKFDPRARTDQHISCRGVGYFDAASARSFTRTPVARPGALDAACTRRIVVSTVDARLLTLDAATGRLCRDFGDDGTVDLTRGMGDTENSDLYHPTSAPAVMGNLIVVGGWVWDIEKNAPAGVVRAFDAQSGALAWAWDASVPGGRANLRPGENYALGTPNVWSPIGFDEALGLVYLPTGNSPPDYWGGNRSAAAEALGSSVVAVDARTGRTRWTFQTTHHDVWDYDVPSQPTLFDMDDGRGGKVPALIQTTKRGQIFVLDRRTGVPLSRVVERPVPQTPVAEGDRMAPTQPYSVDMPAIGGDRLTEKSMWGVSTFDQLWCRIDFRQHNYQGDFTPPTEKPYLQWPGVLGGMNWGGVSIDPRRGLMFVNDIEVPIRMGLVRREEAARRPKTKAEVSGGGKAMRPQLAGPFGGIDISMMMSPLGVPCSRPPFGTMSAIDLKTKKLVWQTPMGTVQDTGPLGIKTHLPVPIGMTTLGGPTSTASGLVFFAGTQDYYLRAISSATGRELWRARLPVGSVAAPLVYTSPRTGRQYVVISAGGTSYSKDKGDYIIAYALPNRGR